MAWFVLQHALLTVGPYIDSCVPFQIMSNQLNVPQVDSNKVVEASQGWSVENRMHLSSILSVMVKALYTFHKKMIRKQAFFYILLFVSCYIVYNEYIE